MISLPAAGAMRGFLINTFYFAPAKAGRGENYGLVFNAPLEAVIDAFPELAGRETVNGYLRRLLRLSDETGDRGAGRKTLLVCSGGMRDLGLMHAVHSTDNLSTTLLNTSSLAARNVTIRRAQ